MNLTIKTLDQIHIALDAIEEARAEIFLNVAEKAKLEAAAIQLRNLERSIIRTQETELVQALTNDSKELNRLVAEIKESAEKLGKLSEVVEKASKGVEALIQILVTATAAGIL
jgi:uncharacterized protein YlxW (UPF0749 family)